MNIMNWLKVPEETIRHLEGRPTVIVPHYMSLSTARRPSMSEIGRARDKRKLVQKWGEEHGSVKRRQRGMPAIRRKGDEEEEADQFNHGGYQDVAG